MPLFPRPLIMGKRGLVASGHYLATEAGMRILRQGGNAVDAAAATGFCLSLLEPQDNSPGGEVPTLVYMAKQKKVFAISGVGWAPKAFTIEWCRQNKIALIPGDGYLPACVPAITGTWAAALQRFGTMSLAQVLQPAIELAENGFPMYEALRRRIAENQTKFREIYPSSAEVYLPKGRVPEIGELYNTAAVVR